MKTRINNKSNNKHPAEYQVPLTFKFVVTIEDRKKRYFVHGDCTQTSRIIVFSNRCLKHESNIPVYSCYTVMYIVCTLYNVQYGHAGKIKCPPILTIITKHVEIYSQSRGHF